ncbi:hypothetical protein [uncultured Fibrella sp.]|uniref:hypothetical protein n=1 Tax=uncultured Fibrella sp. TaxID=1284596 RepID=UPI0035C9B381
MHRQPGGRYVQDRVVWLLEQTLKKGAPTATLPLRPLVKGITKRPNLDKRPGSSLLAGYPALLPIAMVTDQSPNDICQREDDMALFMDQFLTDQPLDILAHLQATYPTP